MRRSAALIVVTLALAACGDDADDAAAPPTSTTSTTEATTTTGEPATTTTADDATGSCPDAAPLPADVDDLQGAPVPYDGDGDGEDDALSVYRSADLWVLHVTWAAGGTSEVELVEAGAMGARPVGGYDLDGDGADEAFVSLGGPAAGRIVALFHTDGCDLAPVVDAESGLAFAFPVTATVGTFSGATCDGRGDLDLYTGELADADAGEYLVAQAPYSYADGELTAQVGDAGSITFDEVGPYSTLDCGPLASGL